MFDQDESSRPKRRQIAMLAGVLALLAVSVIWNVLSGDEGDVTPKTRRATDFMATWRCLACGYEAEQPTGPGPRKCPECGQDEFYAGFRFLCPRHGEIRVAFNYDRRGKPSMVKVADGPWVPYIDREKGELNVVCPVCGGSVMPIDAPRPVDHDDSEPLPPGP